MRAEQILAVLMDDQKFKAKVDELTAIEAKLSEVRKIAATVDAAEQLRAEAAAMIETAKEQSKANKEEHRQLVIAARAKAVADAQAAAALVTKERAQFADAGVLKATAEEQIKVCQEQLAFLQERLDMVNAKECQLNYKEQALEAKIYLIKEACNA